MTSTTEPSPAGEAMARIATAQQKMFVVAGRATALSAQGVIATQKRLLDFATRRLRADLETAAAMGRCKGTPEMASLATEFCRQAMSDYAEEATELMRAAAGAVNEAAEEARLTQDGSMPQGDGAPRGH